MDNAKARHTLTSAADDVARVIVYLHSQEPTLEMLDTMEYLRQAERIIRKVKV